MAPLSRSRVRHFAMSKTKPTVGVLCTEPVVKWQYQAHTSKSTAPRKEMCHSGEPVPNGTKSVVSWLRDKLDRALGCALG